jgi:hypothetical protein
LREKLLGAQFFPVRMRPVTLDCSVFSFAGGQDAASRRRPERSQGDSSMVLSVKEWFVLDKSFVQIICADIVVLQAKKENHPDLAESALQGAGAGIFSLSWCSASPLCLYAAVADHGAQAGWAWPRPAGWTALN